MTGPEDPAFVRDITFLEVLHDMRDTTKLTIARLINAVAAAEVDGMNVTMEPKAALAIVKLLTFQDLIVGALSEENMSQKDIAEELLRKIETVAQQNVQEKPE